MSKQKIILVIARSARMLVQSAKRDGYSVLAIDCYADLDTQSMALRVEKVHSLSLSEVIKALSLLQQTFSISDIVYGSGLESHLDTLNYLQQNYRVLGNSYDAVVSVQDKTLFFAKLKQLNIIYPQTSFQPPVDVSNCLIKPLNGEGGMGIKKADYQADISDCYWQEFCPGTAKSVLFISNGRQYKIIGFHKQYFSPIAEHDFVFSGLINQPEIESRQLDNIKHILDKLLSEINLSGINSLDFIENKQQCRVLEVNPRPSASMNLYPADLFAAHIKSCLPGRELDSISALHDYQAYKIIFADKKIRIKQQIAWPDWVLDIPEAGSIIHTGMPICSIITGGKTEHQVNDLMLARQRQLSKLLT